MSSLLRTAWRTPPPQTRRSGAALQDERSVCCRVRRSHAAAPFAPRPDIWWFAKLLQTTLGLYSQADRLPGKAQGQTWLSPGRRLCLAISCWPPAYGDLLEDAYNEPKHLGVLPAGGSLHARVARSCVAGHQLLVVWESDAGNSLHSLLTNLLLLRQRRKRSITAAGGTT